jgi:ribulose bisphosphate carboxylase small subunit
MAVYASLTKAYAQAIYLDGTKRFADIRSEYVEPVKQYAGQNYTVEQIDNALVQGWISQQEHDDTMKFKGV